MSRILEKHEIYSMPLDVIMGINRQWRDGIKMHDSKWLMLTIKHPDYDVNKYITRTYPELKDQFEWEQMSGNERMAVKFGHVQTHQGHYNGGGYDRDLDPFYEE